MARPPEMKRRWGRHRRLASWLAALGVLLAGGTLGLPAQAVETPVGSKNFTAPTYVPNYFSNESGAFTGARGTPPGAAPVYAAPRPSARSSYGYASASHRAGRYRRGAASHRSYYHRAHGRLAARRHLVHVAARGRRQSLHARPAAAHHRAVRPHRRASAGARRLARAGR